MKKFLLTIGLTFSAFVMNAQVIFYVEAPSPNEGNYDFEFATAGDGWGVMDLTDPANAVTDTLVLVDDGSAADSLGCGALINGADINGQIAVLYRGTCEFGTKAKMAQDAGAVAVVIINNVPGAPVGMLGGTDGPDVTIPVVMIGQATGALLRAEIDAQATTAFIGSKSLYFNNDLGFYAEHVLRAKEFSNIQLLSQSAAEFEVEVGGWVFNYGSDAQTNVTLTATIDLGGTMVYDETSAPVGTLNSGDSIFISLPIFAQTSYANGYYNMVYTLEADLADEFSSDNSVVADFMMTDSLYGYSRMDETTLKPLNVAAFRGGGSTSSNTACIAFNNANASRLGIYGMTFSAATTQNPSPTSLEGEYLEIYAFKWEDVFTDINDPGFALDNLTEVATAEYIFTADIQNENLFIPFEAPVALEDDQRYLFCVAHYGANMFLGYDTEIDYTQNINNYLQPMFPTESDGTWFGRGFGEDVVPAMSVYMLDANALSIVELPVVQLEAFPNPASEFINIPLNGDFGKVDMTITDINGKLIATQNAVMEGNMLKVDVTTFATGTYIVKLAMENGETGTVQVMVTR